jgi:hypothetical protein
MKLLNRKRERHIADSVIADPEQHTTMDRSGAVRSIQAANVDMPLEQLQELWNPTHLERLARTYWKYLSRISLGLIRVHYTDEERAVVFITHPFVMLRFHPPDYELAGVRGVVRWRIRDGLLVARRDDGYLEIDVRLMESPRPGYGRVHVEVEVANFYPALARPFKWFYTNTQSRIHVLVTHGFLRSLARLELEESAVGRFAVPAPAPAPAGGNGNGAHAPVREHEDVTVGDTPWPVVFGIAAAFAALGAILALRLRRP